MSSVVRAIISRIVKNGGSVSEAQYKRICKDCNIDSDRVGFKVNPEDGRVHVYEQSGVTETKDPPDPVPYPPTDPTEYSTLALVEKSGTVLMGLDDHPDPTVSPATPFGTVVMVGDPRPAPGVYRAVITFRASDNTEGPAPYSEQLEDPTGREVLSRHQLASVDAAIADLEDPPADLEDLEDLPAADLEDPPADPEDPATGTPSTTSDTPDV